MSQADSQLTISCILFSKDQFYDGAQWDANIRHARLYSPWDASDPLLSMKHNGHSDIRGLYFIQNSNFDYYSGTAWVYDVASAKTYTLEEAEAALKNL